MSGLRQFSDAAYVPAVAVLGDNEARPRFGRCGQNRAQIFPTISSEQIDLGDGDPLADEVAAFVKGCARAKRLPSRRATVFM
jgi:hypothetical protein